MAVDDRSRTGSSGGRTILIILVVIAVLALLAWALGLFSVQTEGELKAPEVSVQGGEVPDVDVDTGEVVVGTTETTVDVPDVDVDVGTQKETVDVPVVGVKPANPDEE